ncbi:Gx transporter family protein [Alkalicella caledoniensis]|uniref:Gx transporter family protein n=1 Tax=Alkalicella caledoniensis TaxID=2731377 RepID=A0A7G9W4K3_ALKCA|nr:Gx transporter family protein [Alkalicella caledoniensis]QNO13615.1 Gx transporter family protein [Alkalicella caledoniensis]
MRRQKTFKLVHIALLIAMATIINIFEKIFPVLPVAGAKLGLANIFSLVGLNLFGFVDGFTIAITRAILASLITGTFGTAVFFLSFSGAITSTLVMGLMVRFLKGKTSNIGISIVGAIVHNATQLFVTSIFLNSFYFYSYLPYMLFFAIPTGIFVGVTTNYLIKKLSKILKVQEI